MGGMRLLAAAGGLEIIWNLEDILFCLTGILGLFMLYVAYRLNDRAKKRYDEEHGTLTEQFEAVKKRNLASDKPVGNMPGSTQPLQKSAGEPSGRYFSHLGQNGLRCVPVRAGC